MPSSDHLSRALFVLAASAALPACFNCTDVGCSSGLTIDFEWTEWQAGEYVLEVDIAGEAPGMCTFDLPEDSTFVRCDEEESLVAEVYRQGDIVTAQVFVGGAPEEVAVTLSSGETALATELVEPVWSEFRPNGPNCGPLCEVADVTITL